MEDKPVFEIPESESTWAIESAQNPECQTSPRSCGENKTNLKPKPQKWPNQQSGAAGSFLKWPAADLIAGRCAAQAESQRRLRGGSGSTSWKQRACKLDPNSCICSVLFTRQYFTQCFCECFVFCLLCCIKRGSSFVSGIALWRVKKVKRSSVFKTLK